MDTIEFEVPDDFWETKRPKFDVGLNLDEAGAVLSDDGVVSFDRRIANLNKVHVELYGGEVVDGVWHSDINSVAFMSVEDVIGNEIQGRTLTSPLICNQLRDASYDPDNPLRLSDIVNGDDLMYVHGLHCARVAETDDRYSDIEFARPSENRRHSIILSNCDFSKYPELLDVIDFSSLPRENHLPAYRSREIGYGVYFKGCTVPIPNDGRVWNNVSFESCSLIGNKPEETSLQEDVSCKIRGAFDDCGFYGDWHRVDLSGSYLRGRMRADFNASQCDFSRMRFETKLTGCDIGHADIDDCTFAGTRLVGISCYGDDTSRLHVSNCDFDGAYIGDADIVNGQFDNCHANKITFNEAHFPSCQFNHCDMGEVHLAPHRWPEHVTGFDLLGVHMTDTTMGSLVTDDANRAFICTVVGTQSDRPLPFGTLETNVSVLGPEYADIGTEVPADRIIPFEEYILDCGLSSVDKRLLHTDVEDMTEYDHRVIMAGAHEVFGEYSLPGKEVGQPLDLSNLTIEGERLYLPRHCDVPWKDTTFRNCRFFGHASGIDMSGCHFDNCTVYNARVVDSVFDNIVVEDARVEKAGRPGDVIFDSCSFKGAEIFGIDSDDIHVTVSRCDCQDALVDSSALSYIDSLNNNVEGVTYSTEQLSDDRVASPKPDLIHDSSEIPVDAKGADDGLQADDKGEYE